MPGIFTISLDFELHWGGFEKWKIEVGSEELDAKSKEGGSRQLAVGYGQNESNITVGAERTSFFQPAKNYNEYFLNTRRVIPEMLRMFAEHEVHVTWATVGLLMHASKTQALANFPALQPTYAAPELSAYTYINANGLGTDEAEDPFHFADSLVRQIIATPNQELGSHTFAHYYCNEAGQTLEQFQADLQSAQRAAQAYQTKLVSLVFPRNQFNDTYLQVCYDVGIRAVRSNPVSWFWNINTREESWWKRLNRGLDAYWPVGAHNSYRLSDIPVRPGFPVCIPASRLLRPYRPSEFFLNDLKIQRIQSEMQRAASRGEVYHLWWHPHNFGRHPEQSLNALTQILATYQQLRATHGMESCTMGEITNRLLS
jgi:peptidoglycan/xylan/chitin deacetylase (PgdA/CDA1 family)